MSYYYLEVDTTFDLSGIDPDFPVQPPPESENVTSVAAIGLTFEYDSRDNSFGPRRGRSPRTPRVAVRSQAIRSGVPESESCASRTATGRSGIGGSGPCYAGKRA